MAFAQQHRRPQHRHQRSLSTSADELISDNQDFAPTSHILSPRVTQPTTSASDSDNDWHVISSASRRSSAAPRRDSESSFLAPSETSSSLRQSDTESFSDIDTLTSSVRNEFTTLPAHDGTGTFLDEPGYFSDGTNRSQDEADSPSAFARVVHRMLDNRQSSHSQPWRANINDFVPESASMPNILLPHGGITVPSFASSSTNQPAQEEETSEQSLPSFRPTVPNAPIQSGSQSDTSASHNASLSDNVKFARRRRRNLDR
ncbi:hypothetical protein BJV82DRAFT_409865 [Fennellomyces sp. T-0311]|nr:hypothetical protein BJV82DRAFT_409865 [Fennellomyces sp. T-0311]